MKIYNNILELIGNTPILKLNSYVKNNNLNLNLYAKLESYNPASSVKDRIALKILEDAEKGNLLRKDTVIIEATSGNTGIALAMIGKIKGYKVILTMPENASQERIQLLKAYGADVVLTDSKLGMQGAINKATEISKNYVDSYIPNQFTNMSNTETHYLTTGPEIWDTLDGCIDCLVVGVGTGGTISGVGKYLKEKNPNIKIIAVEPKESPLLSKGQCDTHGIQGIGANIIPQTLNLDIIDEIVTVSTTEAYCAAKEIAEYEGILVGISSGAVLSAIKKIKCNNKNVVVILPDSGERYLSNNLYN